jgi:D-tyrosyl-tRNA(Tyr) deacylase
VSVAGQVVGAFDGPGLVILVGVTHDDTPATAVRLADKSYDLRVFGPEGEGSAGREVSAADLGLPVLVVSQFTLYADTRKGRRPTWDAAAPRPVAEPLVDEVVRRLRERGATVSTGVFGADMQVSLTNDGPITILLEV